MFFSVILSLYLLVRTGYSNFSVSDGRPCPMQTVTFTCTTPGDTVRWEASDLGATGILLRTSTSPLGMPLMPHPDYTVILTSFDNTSLTSTLSRRAENGIPVTCVDPPSEQIGSATIDLADSPSPPLNVSHTIQGTSEDSVNVSVQWDPSTENGGRDDLSYIVTILELNYSKTDATSTSATVTDAAYNVDYTVSVVATNCAGNSSTVQYTFIVARCPVPTLSSGVELVGAPRTLYLENNTVEYRCPGDQATLSTCGSNGLWYHETTILICPTTAPPVTCAPPSPPANGSIVDSVMGPSDVSDIINYRCDNGLFPIGNLPSTCGSDGIWRPNPQNQTCSTEQFTCTVPEAPTNGFVDVITDRTIVFRCNEGYSLGVNGAANCVAMDQWNPSPEIFMCMMVATIPTASPIGPIVGGVVGGFLFLIVLIVIIIIVLLVVSSKRAKYTVPAGPVYDEVSPAPNQQIELNTNSAYGPVTPGPVYEDVLSASKEEIELKTNDAYGHLGRKRNS